MTQQGVTDVEIVRALRKLLRDRIDAGTYVILNGDGDRNYYIQFALQKGVLFCEAVHNRYLAPEDRLTLGHARRLVGLGWRKPGKGHRNWFRTFEPKGARDFKSLVGLTRQAFREAYGLPEGAALTLECSWDGQVFSDLPRFRFASEGHRSAWETVARAVGELSSPVVADTNEPILFLRRRSLTTMITVGPVGVHSSLVRMTAPLASGVAHPPPDLMQWLLARNAELRFGALSLADGEVALGHSLVGDSVTVRELMVVLPEFVDVALRLRRELGRRPTAKNGHDEGAGSR